eukprot:gene15144-biopygen17155
MHILSDTSNRIHSKVCTPGVNRLSRVQGKRLRTRPGRLRFFKFNRVGRAERARDASAAVPRRRGGPNAVGNLNTRSCTECDPPRWICTFPYAASEGGAFLT